ncbi:type II toxin-antitoxin system RelE family toxin [Candidatus Binatus sp.]|uniref:type II toxin-antitoxin system RelE family toxin n=1 Tax=Candidatus Binatus sp. TaxID=2811406 RepID=UPI003C3FF61F
MPYAIEFAPGAKRELGKLPREVQLKLNKRIDSLSLDPRPRGSKKLKGGDELWRVRVGDYRVVYEVRDKVLVVLVVRVAHRREVYR